MTEHELQQLIARGEGPTIEFKQNNCNPAVIGERMSALANAAL